MKRAYLILTILIAIAAQSAGQSHKFDTIKLKRGGKVYRCLSRGDTLFLNSDTIIMSGRWQRDGDQVYPVDFEKVSVGIKTDRPTRDFEVNGQVAIDSLTLYGDTRFSTDDGIVVWDQSDKTLKTIPVPTATLRHKKVSLTNTQVSELGGGSPVELLPSLASGYFYVVQSVEVYITVTTRLEFGTGLLYVYQPGHGSPSGMFKLSNANLETASSDLFFMYHRYEDFDGGITSSVEVEATEQYQSGSATMDFYIEYLIIEK
jgi:hypothetical protein